MDLPVEVPDIDNHVSLRPPDFRQQTCRYQQYLHFLHRHDDHIQQGLLDVETAIQHDLISYPTAYLMAKMTSDTARIAGEHFNLHYFDQHFISLRREVHHFLSHEGITWFSLMIYIGYLATLYDKNYLDHDVQVFGEENPETVQLLSRFFLEEQPDEEQEQDGEQEE